MPGDVAGQGLADLAADLIDARRIDHDQPGPFQAGPVGRVVLPALGGAGDRCAVGRADLEDVLAHQALRTDDLPRLTMPKAAISIVVSSSFWPRSRSCASSPARAVSSSGVSLRLGKGRFEAFLGALDGLVVFVGLAVQLVEQLVQLVIGHG